MIFYYVRHGEPIYDPDSLTEYGEEQAKALGKRFALYGLDEIYSSPSSRAFQTAQATCDVLGETPTILDWTNEGLAWNEFTIVRNGCRTWLFHDSEYYEKFRSGKMQALGENWVNSDEYLQTFAKKGKERIDKEVDEFFLRLGFKHDREKGGFEVVQPNEKRVALFAHQGFGLAFLSSLMDIPYPAFCTKFDMGHSGVTAIHFENKNGFSYPKILQLSNDSHLYKEEILTGYQNRIDL